MATLASYFNVPILLIVGLKLGCLNAALLTYESILQKKLSVAGWVANQMDPSMQCVKENIDFLKKKIKSPYLGWIRYKSPRSVYGGGEI